MPFGITFNFLIFINKKKNLFYVFLKNINTFSIVNYFSEYKHENGGQGGDSGGRDSGCHCSGRGSGSNGGGVADNVVVAAIMVVVVVVW